MSILVTDCPHCEIKRVSMEFKGEYQKPNEQCTEYCATYSCPNCDKPVSVITTSTIPAQKPSGSLGNILEHRYWVTKQIIPTPEITIAPKHTPDRVADFYIQAINNAKAQHKEGAILLFRRTLEEAVKQLAPEAKGDLIDRIRSLDHEHITPAMKDWAHTIRIDGNEAAHGDEEFSQQAVDDLMHFIELFLLYAFTLPGMLAERKKSK